GCMAAPDRLRSPKQGQVYPTPERPRCHAASLINRALWVREPVDIFARAPIARITAQPRPPSRLVPQLRTLTERFQARRAGCGSPDVGPRPPATSECPSGSQLSVSL